MSTQAHRAAAPASASDPEALPWLSASDLLAGYSSGELSPVTVVDAVLARIASFDDRLAAFALIDAAGARAAAQASAERWRQGAPAGLLDGVPVSLKDLLAVAGLPLRRGSRATSEVPSAEDSPAAARLRQHGAVILGTTATAEFGLGGHAHGASGEPTRNPWDPARTPGGSSSGAVAAVAAGLGPIAVGTDGGGSIRVPAAYSGVVGFKPSFGRVPHAPASFICVPAHDGPIARSVADATLLFSVLTGPDARDPFHLPRQAEGWHQHLSEPLTGLRIGFTTAPDAAGPRALDPGTAAAFHEAIIVLRSLGARVDEARLGLPEAGPVQRILAAGRAALTIRAFPPEQRALIGPEVLELARAGESLTAVDYLEAEAARVSLAEAVALAHQRFDLLLTPTAPTSAPLLPTGVPVASGAPAKPGWSTPGFASIFSLTRQPAISVPAGRSPDGLPVGIQLVGRFGDDALVLRAAHQFEQRRGPFARPSLAWLGG